MLILGLIGLAGLSLIGLISVLIYPRISIKWLYTSVAGIVLSLPFERIPSIDVGVSLRVGLITVFLSLWFGCLLLLKNIPRVVLDRITVWLGVFVLVSLPSVIFVLNVQRFAISWIAISLVFIGSTCITYFTPNPSKLLQKLFKIMAGVTVFGYYQYIGDVIGLPQYLTGLHDLYTKEIFGFPRMQATAQEPLYFGGMLFFPIILCLASIWKKQNVWSGNQEGYSVTKNLFTLMFFCIALLLTISNSAIISLSFGVGALFLLILGHLNVKLFAGRVFSLGALSLFFGSAVLLIFPSVLESVGVAIQHTINSLTGRSPSNIERTLFLMDAFRLLPLRAITGIGAGQFGVYSIIKLPNQQDTQFLIVNNVYVEIWLEHGITALFIFLGMWVDSLKRGISYFTSKLDVYSLTLISTLVSYLVQWVFFSPIYIMPIFIFLGLLISLVRQGYPTHVTHEAV